MDDKSGTKETCQVKMNVCFLNVKRILQSQIICLFRSGRELTAGSVATFNVDHKSAKELRQYLANIADQCENTNVNALPSAIILDNLHHVTSLADVFNGFLSVKYQKW